MKTRSILVLGVCIVILLIALAVLEVLNLVVAGLLLTATIGVVGWILSYSTKSKEKITPSSKTIKKQEFIPPKEPKTVLDETCVVEEEEYVFYDLDLNANEVLKGEITSSKTINIYFLTTHAFRRFENREDFSYEYGSEGILKKRIEFKPPRTAAWYLVLENEGDNRAKVDIHLFI